MLTKVFISYAWESEEHREWVKALANRLLSDGIDAVLELMRKTANSTGTANRSAIQLDTCIVRVSKNWFVVVGTCQK